MADIVGIPPNDCISDLGCGETLIGLAPIKKPERHIGAHLTTEPRLDDGAIIAIVDGKVLTDAEGTVIENEFCDSPISEY